MNRDGFFVGWAWRSARPLAWFLAGLTGALLLGAATMALLLGASIDDPGGGNFAGERTLTGVLVAEPYPLVITDPDSTHPLGHAVMLAGWAKSGVQANAAALNGRRVTVSGLAVKRGTLDMLLTAGAQPIDGGATPPAVQALGTWRLTGEVCDGKCYAGVMRPGGGTVHKACANVCLLGGVPPVLVATSPVAGSEFLLMADQDGKALPDALRDHVAILQRMDGSVIRLADLLIFRTDIAAARDP